MTDQPTFKALQILGVTTSVFLSGFSFSASYLSCPAIALAPPSLAAQQWLKIYDLGALVSPTTSIVSSLIWASVSWTSYHSPGSAWKAPYYAVAGVSTFGVLAWTLGVMMPTNMRLVEMARAAKGAKGAGGGGGGKGRVGGLDAREVDRELGSWNMMNYIRASLPMVGAVVGLWAVVN